MTEAMLMLAETAAAPRFFIAPLSTINCRGGKRHDRIRRYPLFTADTVFPPVPNLLWQGGRLRHGMGVTLFGTMRWPVCSGLTGESGCLFMSRCKLTQFHIHGKCVLRNRQVCRRVARRANRHSRTMENLNEKNCLCVCCRSGDFGGRIRFASRSHCSASARSQSGKSNPSVLLAWSPLGSLRMVASPPMALLVNPVLLGWTCTAAGNGCCAPQRTIEFLLSPNVRD